MTVLANRFLELSELLPRFEKESGSQIQSAALMIAETLGVGFIVQVNVTGVPLQPFAVGVIDMVEQLTAE